MCSQPRLGPKPFQAKTTAQEFSFDKVFSVPQVPTAESNGHVGNGNGNGYVNDGKNEIIDDVDKSPVYEVERKESENAKSDSSSMEEDANSSDSGYKPKTPSTAERRKLFEVKVSEKMNPSKIYFEEPIRIFDHLKLLGER